MELQHKEVELWERVLNEHDKRPGERIRIVPLAESIGLHPTQARQFSRTWKNRGWVDFNQNPNTIYVLEDRPITSLNDQ